MPITHTASPFNSCFVLIGDHTSNAAAVTFPPIPARFPDLARVAAAYDVDLSARATAHAEAFLADLAHETCGHAGPALAWRAATAAEVAEGPVS